MITVGGALASVAIHHSWQYFPFLIGFDLIIAGFFILMWIKPPKKGKK